MRYPCPFLRYQPLRPGYFTWQAAQEDVGRVLQHCPTPTPKSRASGVCLVVRMVMSNAVVSPVSPMNSYEISWNSRFHFVSFCFIIWNQQRKLLNPDWLRTPSVRRFSARTSGRIHRPSSFIVQRMGLETGTGEHTLRWQFLWVRLETSFFVNMFEVNTTHGVASSCG